jgi:5-oxoprolinase (ATP-hydrolysing)/N-methylhydantoinase B
MRFANKRFYVERYIKCDCCGVLIYDQGLATAAPDGAPRLFCSQWCRDWLALRDRGEELRLALPRAERESQAGSLG